MLDAFTFHYGPIQIAVVENFKDNVKAFTFHYGPIQISVLFFPESFISNLHSTMVLFKLLRHTFATSYLMHLHSTMVLFK